VLPTLSCFWAIHAGVRGFSSLTSPQKHDNSADSYLVDTEISKVSNCISNDSIVTCRQIKRIPESFLTFDVNSETTCRPISSLDDRTKVAIMPEPRGKVASQKLSTVSERRFADSRADDAVFFDPFRRISGTLNFDHITLP
jgi:hypothetical protein